MYKSKADQTLRITSLQIESASCNPSSPRDYSSPRRECAKWQWQEDSEAMICSIAECGKEIESKLTALLKGKSSRHHCRMCGRIVCADCSMGRKLLLPATGQGLARHVRVCAACMQIGENFKYEIPDLSRSSSMPMGLGRQSRSVPSIVDLLPSAESSSTSSSPSQHMESKEMGPGSLSLAGNTEETSSNSAPTVLNKNELAASARTQEEHSPMEEQISRADTPSMQEGKIGAVTDEDAEERRIARLEGNLKKFSFYEGMKTHEPQALRALLKLSVNES
ncbi:hypothetical protein GUITHDRAFT_108919 [Guillardia theta CCMP2712]|uniref:FYVE-type domain-containing protein n=1 Tax=Guillardia theta (strain CCMP2712) TaxID=905079 RepID=L1JAG1_GUITC|nr:hypothetical protein GUITHDRAFT_108919 [Guillardia theta CCMP2712]EKX45277.1 hypothetical protein GUITHDRAFT_108919 [Guillardia theta CCMP2712]|eukprot:XP_005832257.1 hypothetical protein GUITHDRAFT_108919 [Guillardia theta CCMP2712]